MDEEKVMSERQKAGETIQKAILKCLGEMNASPDISIEVFGNLIISTLSGIQILNPDREVEIDAEIFLNRVIDVCKTEFPKTRERINKP